MQGVIGVGPGRNGALGRRAPSTVSSDGFQGLEGLLGGASGGVGGGGLPEGQLLQLAQQQARRDAQVAAAGRCAASPGPPAPAGYFPRYVIALDVSGAQPT